MVSTTFKIFGYLFGLITAYVVWLDLSTDRPSIVLGQFWFEHHAPSLQVTESIISRYIDPCGLIVALGCEPFLWHPIIATTLGWPASLNFIALALIFFGIGRFFRGKGGRRVSGQALRRNGAK